jgi:hypothetical protein
MRSEYRKLGLKIVSLKENQSHIPNKPSMAIENKNSGEEYYINPLLEKSLPQKRDEMMENFSHILQCLQ